jgi:hypothetical protein
LTDSSRWRRCRGRLRRTAYDDGRLRITRRRRRLLALAGVINEHTRAGLVGALGKLTAGQHEIRISLRDVTSCELAGLRAIILLTGACGDDQGGDRGGDRGGAPHRLVVLFDVPPHLTSILWILGWDRTPGLVIAGPNRRHATAPRADQAWPAAGLQPGHKVLAFARPITVRRAAAGGSRPRSERTTA